MKQKTEATLSKRLRKHGRMERDEEETLIEHIKETPTDDGAKERLVASNVGMIIRISRRFVTGAPTTLEHSISLGAIGLLRAIANYDSTKTARFINHASWYIEDEFRKEYYRNAHHVDIPPKKRQLYYRFRKALNANEGNYTKTIELEEFAPFKDDIDQVMMMTSETYSIDAKSDDPDSINLSETIADKRVLTEHDSDIRKMILVFVDDILTEREKDLLFKKHGFMQPEEKTYTLEELAKLYGVNKETIRRQIGKALNKMLQHADLRKCLIHFLTP